MKIGDLVKITKPGLMYTGWVGTITAIVKTGAEVLFDKRNNPMYFNATSFQVVPSMRIGKKKWYFNTKTGIKPVQVSLVANGGGRALVQWENGTHSWVPNLRIYDEHPILPPPSGLTSGAVLRMLADIEAKGYNTNAADAALYAHPSFVSELRAHSTIPTREGFRGTSFSGIKVIENSLVKPGTLIFHGDRSWHKMENVAETTKPNILKEENVKKKFKFNIGDKVKTVDWCAHPNKMGTVVMLRDPSYRDNRCNAKDGEYRIVVGDGPYTRDVNSFNMEENELKRVTETQAYCYRDKKGEYHWYSQVKNRPSMTRVTSKDHTFVEIERENEEK